MSNIPSLTTIICRAFDTEEAETLAQLALRRARYSNHSVGAHVIAEGYQ